MLGSALFTEQDVHGTSDKILSLLKKVNACRISNSIICDSRSETLTGSLLTQTWTSYLLRICYFTFIDMKQSVADTIILLA